MEEQTQNRGGQVRESQNPLLDIDGIMAKLPHRYPFLMIDKVLHVEDNHLVICSKCVTINEPYFQGHFPGKPVMPGVMMLEAMAQAGAILARVSTSGVPDEKWIFLVGATDVKWRKLVRPGDQLTVQMKVAKKRRPLWIMEGLCTINGEFVASATISAMESD